MPDKWVTLAEAAAAMKVHPRTVERHIKSGKLESRRTDAGQLEVVIEVPEEAVIAPDALSVVAGQAENQVQLALGATSALVKSAQEDARLARTDAERAWQETHAARRGATFAWSTVGVMAVAIMVAICWTTSTITRTHEQLQQADDKVRTATDSVGQLQSENQRLHSEVAQASQRADRAEGELSGRVSADEKHFTLLAHSQQRSSTQPTGLFDRLANILSGSSADGGGQ